MKTAFNYIVLIAALLMGLFSCAPKAVIVEPIAPKTARAHAAVRAAGAASKRLDTQVQELHRENKDIGKEIALALAEADRQRVAGMVTQADLAKNWQTLSDIKASHFMLESKLLDATATAAELKPLQITAEEGLAELEADSVKLDKGVVGLKTEIAKQAPDAAVGKWFKGTVTTIAITATILCLIALVLWGMSKFRVL